MAFQVIWTNKSQDQLTELWIAANDRQAIRAAADTLDRDLAATPYDVGEERSNGVRIAIARPLIITFQTSEPDRRVQVLTVRRIATRR